MENKEIDYANPKGSFDDLPQEIKDKLFIMDEYEDWEYIENIELINVESEFTMADNYFDLSEANNTVHEYNVKQVKTVTFTGGDYLATYVKEDPSKLAFILQGNDEEGYNVFVLN